MSGQYLRAIETKNSRIPVWMMRQAGRYLPEYREIRKQHSFLDMVYTPSVAAEITCQPIRRFDFDAAILFSDILVTPQALGMALQFTNGVGPEFLTPIRSKKDASALSKNMATLGPIYETIYRVKQSISKDTALIGFAGAPFTVVSYMIEGGSSKDLKHTKKMMVSDPELFKHIMDQVMHVTIDYLHEQVKAGVDALQIFDTWINHLDWESCEKHSAQYVEKMVSELRHRGVTVPITFFGKQTSVFYPLYASTGVDIISIDWNGDMRRIDADLAPLIGLQGNLDPFVLYGHKEHVQNKVIDICKGIQSGRPFIFNLGHGIMPDIPIEAVQWAIDAVRSQRVPVG